MHAPPLVESLLAGGLSGEDEEDAASASAGIQWCVWTQVRIINLLTKIAAALGVKDP